MLQAARSGCTVGMVDEKRRSLAELRARAAEGLASLDEAIDAVGSRRAPEARTDHAPIPYPVLPIYNPSTLSY